MLLVALGVGVVIVKSVSAFRIQKIQHQQFRLIKPTLVIALVAAGNPKAIVFFTAFPTIYRSNTPAYPSDYNKVPNDGAFRFHLGDDLCFIC